MTESMRPAKADEDAAREIVAEYMYSSFSEEWADSHPNAPEAKAFHAITAALAAQRRASDERIARLRKVVDTAARIESDRSVLRAYGTAASVSHQDWSALAETLAALQEGDR